MKKGWGIVLSGISMACLLTVTTATVTIWAVRDKNKDIAGSGTVTITGDISAEMTAGKQVNRGVTALLSGTVGGESVELADIDLYGLSSFNIGNIPASAGDNINVYFVIANKSLTDTLKVTVTLTDGEGEEFNEEYVTAVKYITAGEIETALGELDYALTGFDTEHDRVNDIGQLLGGITPENYLAYYGVTEYEDYLLIPPNSVRAVIIRYETGIQASTFGMGVALCVAPA